VYFATYAKAKEIIGQGKEEHAGVHIGAAVVAGVTVNTVTNPIWVIKTRLQLQNAVTGVAYSGAMDCVRKVWQQEGLAGLYKGLFASYLGSSPTIIRLHI
jgi:solute carrier family 25 protein 33/36